MRYFAKYFVSGLIFHFFLKKNFLQFDCCLSVVCSLTKAITPKFAIWVFGS